MKVDYAYCSECGAEFLDVVLAHSATYANGDFYICPECGEELSEVQVCVNMVSA